MTKKVLWQEMLRHELEGVREERPVVIVPTGSVEQHGPACPLDVDISIPQAMAVRAAEAVEEFPVLVAPAVWSGYTHYNMGFIGTISLRLETYNSLITDICRSIHQNGFHRIVLLNGHGGNRNPNQVLAVNLSQEDIYVLALTYWEMLWDEMKRWGERDSHIGHGGEWETSLQLYLRPQLVDQSRAKCERYPEYFGPYHAFARFPERRRHTPFGVEGDGRVASAEKGEKLFKAGVEKLVGVCRKYHEIEPPHYQHGEW